MLRSRRLSYLVALSILVACPVLPALAQDSAVLDRLEDRYDILELSDGWLLQPTDGRDDFRAIEVRDGRVAVDGEWVDENELRRFVDDDAALISALAEGRSVSVEAPPAPSPSPAPAVPPAPRFDDRELRAEELEQVREQLEDALERARRGDYDREVLDRLQEIRNFEDLPREIDRMTRELKRVIDRSQRRGTRRGRDSQVTLGSNLTVERGDKVSEVVVIGGDLDVRGEIDGDSTVVLGSAIVSGYVDGTLVVVGGDIDVESGGTIDGDAIAVGGAVRTDSGGHVDGEIIHLDFGELMHLGNLRIGDVYWPRFGWFDFGVFDAIGRIFRIVFLAILALLVYVLAGAKVEELGSWVRGAPWRSLFSGLAVEIAFVPAVFIVFVLLCVSVIGLLVACFLPPLAIFLLMVVFLIGYTSVALSIGDWIARRFGLQYGNRYLVILLGMAAIEVWSVLGDMVGLIGFLGWIGALILFAAWCFKFILWTVGLGAVVLCHFSRDPSLAASGPDWNLSPGPGAPPPPAPPGPDASDDGAYDEDRDYPLLRGDEIEEGEETDEPERDEDDDSTESTDDPQQSP